MWAWHRRHSLFRSTAATVAAALIIFQLITLAVTVYYVMLPIAKRSADDLASLMVLSAQTWVELPPQTREDFELELAKRHNLWLFRATTPLPEGGHDFLPYLMLLESALQARTGEPIEVKTTQWEEPWFWVEIPSGGYLIRIGFPREHLGMRPPLAVLLMLAATIMLTLITAIILARRITRPLARLSEAATRIGQGNAPETLQETGAEELASLARTFNRMAFQVKELLANRTTLLAGISHDLRTPLARMRLALEMLPQDSAPQHIDRLRRDMEEMNRLIGEFLALSRGLEKETEQEIDLSQLLQELADHARNEGAQVEWQAQPPCPVLAGPMALKRILGNLIGNAVRYGAGKPLTLICECHLQTSVIQVLDRGPGIPPDQLESVFRPFYRLESSRSITTGGSGLGLAIARQLAEANGWTIELLPREGGGTEARLTLTR
ncbi:MAG: ATP-binding protein [Sulfurimicrobium sp.]|nr:ATP-binding protein [Sulfurimicrobium sp.]MDO9188696.1 ATP-binding protein [Sulfurimicrobium sp.]MDP1703210.1 ATP-binding protein [Sulfurimicrobium sp.]MDP2199084.1 ATP-binding protein [Sulfurimicrobium sp.]MDP2962136.1 ATP-binding protein [Sulfurimicrobium sp.]